jgi:hypothetical protein
MSDLLASFSERLLPVIREQCLGPSFSDLALELFEAQRQSNAAYRRFIEASGRSSAVVRRCEDIPAVPTVAFKELDLTALPLSERTRVFHSSGTTGHRPSRHYHGTRSLALYEASMEAGFDLGFWRGATADGESAAPVGGWVPLSLTPPAADVPHSSLVHMVDGLGARQDRLGTRYLGRLSTDGDGAWELDVETATSTLIETARAGRPMVVFGTAFNFVHLVEGLDRIGRALQLPAGSRVMETGGYKGRSREWDKLELRTAIARCLGLEPAQIVGEYGMSELSSQAYEQPVVSGWKASDGVSRGFVFPPWARPLVISPETGKVAGEGEVGLLRVLDLANVWSVMAVQTEDRAVQRGGAIELLGRASVSEPRGCSLMAA